jgi:hypothetical protein
MKHTFATIRTAVIVIVAILAALPMHNLQAQAGAKVKCGTILESEFTKNNEVQVFLLTMQARDSFTASVEPVGDHMGFNVTVSGPSGVPIAGDPYNTYQAPSVDSGTLSARGVYNIKVANGTTGVGLYTLSIGCVTSRGTIEPGDAPQPTPTPAPLPTPTTRPALLEPQPAFTGVGFPGLAPVDFATAVVMPLVLDTPMTGVIPIGNEILGFTLDAAAGDTLDLNYTRVSGNMNLGLVVLSENNEVFFQASLVTSAALSTRFTLPVAGQYTIGVFRISLVEPEEVEPTVFQVKGNTTTD